MALKTTAEVNLSDERRDQITRLSEAVCDTLILLKSAAPGAIVSNSIELHTSLAALLLKSVRDELADMGFRRENRGM